MEKRKWKNKAEVGRAEEKEGKKGRRRGGGKEEKEKKNGEEGDLRSTHVLLFDPIQKHYLQLLLRFALPHTMAP